MAAQGEKGGWWKERFPINMARLKEVLGEELPDHMRYWWFCLGGVPLLIFLVLVATGLMLSVYYVPSPEKAHSSIQYIQEGVRFGWWIRGVHHWAAQFMIITVILHVMRVFFIAAYRKPRELCWVAGSLLLLTTLGMGFTGYTLTYTHQAYWAATVGTELAQSVPLIGGFIANFLRGGPTIGPGTLTRLFALHTVILPTFMAIFIFIHVFIMRLHGVAEHAAAIVEEMVRGVSRPESETGKEG